MACLKVVKSEGKSDCSFLGNEDFYYGNGGKFNFVIFLAQLLWEAMIFFTSVKDHAEAGNFIVIFIEFIQRTICSSAEGILESL